MSFFGLPSKAAGGGNYLPVVKYDARAGRVFRVDRNDGVSTPVDITRDFKAIIDFYNVEVGWLRFGAGSAPDMQLVKMGEMLPPQPSPDHRHGVRIVVKLAKSLGGDIREIAGTSSCFIAGFGRAYDEFKSQVSAHMGKLPVCSLVETRPVETGAGAKKSTNYEPVFRIEAWVDRPEDMLVPNLRGGGVAAAPAAPAQAAFSAPPSTGSTPVSAPAPASTGEDDFG